MGNLALIFVPILGVTFLDQAIKQMVLARQPAGRFFIGRITLVANRGIIGGYFSEAAKPFFQIPMVTFGFFLLTLLYFIQLFAPIKSSLMRLAISFFFGGVFANVVDRLIHGYVVDYFTLNAFGMTSTAFNFANVVQIFGVVMIFMWQFKAGTFDEESSTKLWVSKQFQKRYSYQLVILGFFLVLVLGVLSFMFLRTMLDDLATVSSVRSKFLQDYLIFYLSIAVTFLLFLFLVGKSLSAYVVKPILSFENYLRSLSEGNYGVFQVDEPEFSYLEQLSDGVRDHITNLHQEIQVLKNRGKIK